MNKKTYGPSRGRSREARGSGIDEKLGLWLKLGNLSALHVALYARRGGGRVVLLALLRPDIEGAARARARYIVKNVIPREIRADRLFAALLA